MKTPCQHSDSPSKIGYHTLDVLGRIGIINALDLNQTRSRVGGVLAALVAQVATPIRFPTVSLPSILDLSEATIEIHVASLAD